MFGGPSWSSVCFQKMPKSLSCLCVAQTQFCRHFAVWRPAKLRPLYSLSIANIATWRQSYHFSFASSSASTAGNQQGMKVKAALRDKLTNRWQRRHHLGTSCCHILIVFRVLFLFFRQTFSTAKVVLMLTCSSYPCIRVGLVSFVRHEEFYFSLFTYYWISWRVNKIQL